MVETGRIALMVYGVLVLGGGIAGYATKKSAASLIAGGISAILLGLAWYLQPMHHRTAFGLGILVSLALAAQFARSAINRAKTEGTVMPGAALCGLSILALLTFLAALLKGML